MSNELIKKFTEIDIPGGGGIKTDNPVVEAAIAAGIVGIAGIAAYGGSKPETWIFPRPVFTRVSHKRPIE